MERQKKVIDASIIVKWFSEEENTKEALKIRNAHVDGEIVIIIPDLAFLEVLNALKYKKKNALQLKESIKYLSKLDLHVENIGSFLLEKAIEISLEYDFSMYDSLYAALAQLHGCELITADKKLAKLPNAVLLSN